MNEQVRPKDYPISMRLAETEVDVRAAEATLRENGPIPISKEGFAEFLSAISGPARAAPEMVEILRRRAPWNTGAPKT